MGYDLLLNCHAGVAGDMLVGALLGYEPSLLQEVTQILNRLPGFQGDYRIELTQESRGGIMAFRFCVIDNHLLNEEQHHGKNCSPWLPPDHHYLPTSRTLTNILAMIEQCELPERAKKIASQTFQILAQAEAKVHGVSVESIHFHEIGAVDSIVDIVTTAYLIDRLGIDSVYILSLNLGGGTVECMHGTLPVPTPAVSELLHDFPCRLGPIETELTTPTGAALLRGLHSYSGFPPYQYRIKKVTYGAGQKNFKSFPNVIQAFFVEAIEKIEDSLNPPQAIEIIETNLDDMTGELIPQLMEKLFGEGALDMVIFPVTMKKGRPGWVIQVLSPLPKTDHLAKVLLEESTSFGVRIFPARRIVLERQFAKVQTRWGEVRVKLGKKDSDTTWSKAIPEYEDCAKLAKMHQIPLIQVYQEACSQAYLDCKVKKRSELG